MACSWTVPPHTNAVDFGVQRTSSFGGASKYGDVESGRTTRSASLSVPGTPAELILRRRRTALVLAGLGAGLVALVLAITIAVFVASRLFAGAHIALTAVAAAGFATAIVLERDSTQGGGSHCKTAESKDTGCMVTVTPCEGALPPSCVY